ncbi:NAAT family transporter [Bacillus sp. Bos-x628]|uniref:MarC family protein n=1 Tax=Bacillus maqinnsis TaxID=3229854 RepID=UPI00338D7933
MISFMIHVVVSLFAVSNPIGNVPLFITLTEGYTDKERSQTAKKAIVVSFIILFAFLLAGRLIFKLFGIDIHALRIAGGIFIFGIAYNLLNAKESHVQNLHSDENEESKEKADISVTPLAIPIIAGPGTIATVMSLTPGSKVALHMFAILIGIVIVLAMTYYAFHYSSHIMEKLGKTEMNVITRLMGLILAVVAVEMIGAGLKGMFPMFIS